MKKIFKKICCDPNFYFSTKKISCQKYFCILTFHSFYDWLVQVKCRRERSNVRSVRKISHPQHMTFSMSRSSVVMKRMFWFNHVLKFISSDVHESLDQEIKWRASGKTLHNKWNGESFQPKISGENNKKRTRRRKKSHVFRLIFSAPFFLIFSALLFKVASVYWFVCLHTRIVQLTSPILHSIKHSVIAYLRHSIYSVHS